MTKGLGIDPVTLWRALNFKTNTVFARMIRAEALRRGGVVVDRPGIVGSESTEEQEQPRTETI